MATQRANRLVYKFIAPDMEIPEDMHGKYAHVATWASCNSIQITYTGQCGMF